MLCFCVFCRSWILGCRGLQRFCRVFWVFFIISMSLRLIGSMHALLPFSGVMVAILRSKSMSLHFSCAASPHLAPVSFRNWRNVASILPLPEISWSMSASVGTNGTLSVGLYFGGCHERLNKTES